MTQTLEAKRSHYTTATLQEQNVGNNDVDRACTVMSATAIPPWRRCEARMDYLSICSYEVLEAIDEELRAVNVLEVRWTRPVQVELFGNLYLAGCQRIVGRRHCLSF